MKGSSTRRQTPRFQRAHAGDVERRLLELVDPNGRMIVIYDPATTRPNPNGQASSATRSPQQDTGRALQQGGAAGLDALSAKSQVVPNRAVTPGTLAYINNNFQSAGGTTQETTYKFSVKFDQVLNNAQRVAYLFNRVNNLNQPSAGRAVGLPEPFNSASWEGNDPTCTGRAGTGSARR